MEVESHKSFQIPALEGRPILSAHKFGFLFIYLIIFIYFYLDVGGHLVV